MILRLVDHSHPARTELLQDAIVRKGLANLERSHARIVSRLDVRCDRGPTFIYTKLNSVWWNLWEDTGESHTSIEKALEVCEVLSATARGMSLTDLARALASTAF